MSIFIKGLDMPKGGQFIAVFGAGEAYLFEGAYIAESDNCIGEGKAVGVQTTHGKIIDAEWVIQDICNSIDEMTDVGISVDAGYLWRKIFDAIENAPTVIEEEGIDVY